MSGVADDVGPWSADGSFDNAHRFSITFFSFPFKKQIRIFNIDREICD